MAMFPRLDQVGEVLEARLRDLIVPAPAGAIQLGPPIETATGATEAIRLTLLWVTPEPGHRNDPWERDGAGQLLPPPLTVLARFLVTTYGEDTDGRPTRAFELLGLVLRVVHTRPTLQLPADTSSGLGEGPLSVVFPTTELDTMEKLYSPLGVSHRAWALLDVGPIQLPHLAAPAAGAAPVLPGRLGLGGPTAGPRPVLARVTPDRPGPGARIRLDGTFPTPLVRVWVAGEPVDAAAVVELAPGRVLTLTMPAAGPGVRPIRVEAGTSPAQFSDTVEVLVRADAPHLDAPPVADHDVTAPLSLTGRGLLACTALIVWPDAGVIDPADLHEVPVTVVDDAAITVAANVLPTGRLFRLAARIGTAAYTPHVLLELS